MRNLFDLPYTGPMLTAVTIAAMYWAVGFAGWLFVRYRDDGRLRPSDFFAGVFMAWAFPLLIVAVLFYVAWTLRGMDGGP